MQPAAISAPWMKGVTKMDTIKKLEIDLLDPPRAIPRIYLVQGDHYSRKLQVTLLAGEDPWQIPDGAVIGLRYRKQDGTTGSYDSLPNGQSASTYAGNVITLTLAPQVLTAEGCVNAQVEIVSGDEILASFLFQIMVSHDPSTPIYVSQNYFNWQQWTQAQLQERLAQAAGEGLFVPEFSIGTVTTLEPGAEATAQIRGSGSSLILDLGIPAGHNGLLDETLTLAGYGADAAATGTALSGKAPAGYGLGSALPNADCTDANEAVRSGWYRCSGMANTPYTEGWLYVASRDSNWIYQEFYGALDAYNTRLTRVCAAGTWREWEYINPPLDLGVEYRTTERWRRSAVYVMAIDVGAMPNAARKSVSFTIPSGTVDRFLSVTGSTSQGDALPYVTTTTGYRLAVAKGASQHQIIITTDADKSAYTAIAVVKYTKT